jgi:hypothetical protein
MLIAAVVMSVAVAAPVAVAMKSSNSSANAHLFEPEYSTKAATEEYTFNSCKCY